MDFLREFGHVFQYRQMVTDDTLNTVAKEMEDTKDNNSRDWHDDLFTTQIIPADREKTGSECD